MVATEKLPITIVTGYVGSGKTTLILNLLPRLRATNPAYRLALIKNEIGDLNVDSQLAAAAEMTGSRELLGACICCTNVGQIGQALSELETEYAPDRVIIETSGSAEPIKLVMEIKRLSAETNAKYELDGIISVIDVLNWSGYVDTSFTAKLQAKQTDLIILNKWEEAGEEACSKCLDRLGDMEVDTPYIKSDKGWVNPQLLFGLDPKTRDVWMSEQMSEHHHADHASKGDHHHHMEEMECLSITLRASATSNVIDMPLLQELLTVAPKDEVFRIKAVLYSQQDPARHVKLGCVTRHYLNWAFGRSTWTSDATMTSTEAPLLRMSIFTARYESNKWQKRVESGRYINLVDSASKLEDHLTVTRVL